MLESDEKSGGGTRTRSNVGMFCSGRRWVVALGPGAQGVWSALSGPQPSSLMPRGGNNDLIHPD